MHCALRNAENGFELLFYNNLTDTVIVAQIELKVDGIIMNIFVSGTKLPARVHRIDVKTNIQGSGEVSFTIQDHI